MTNPTITKTYINWSGGKDACLSLHHMLKQGLQIDAFLTTISLPYQRITMHGVSKELLQLQTEALGIPLQILELPEGVEMEAYDNLMKSQLHELFKQGFRQAVFGDIFLEDLKHYREKQFEESGIELSFPLWQKDSGDLVREFIDLGYKAKIVAADASKLDHSFLGRTLDHDLLNRLPEKVDPCGENGEFHTFVYDGPLFKKPLDIAPGEVILKKYGSQSDQWSHEFWFCDLRTNR